MSDKNPFGYDSLKLRAIFIPEDNPETITAADITNHVGNDSLRLRAVLIPDGNPDNVTAADITNWLGYDVVRVRYSWSGPGEGQTAQEQEPPAEGPDGGERAGGPNQGTDCPGTTPTGPPDASAMPPTPTLVQAARYVDPAKTAAAAWRAIAALSPPNQPAVPRGADGQGGTVARPDVGSADTPGSSDLDAYVQNDPLNSYNRIAQPGAALQIGPGSGSNLALATGTQVAAADLGVSSDAVASGQTNSNVQPAASADDPQGLKAFNAVVRILQLTPSQARQLHMEITKQGMTYQQILQTAKDMFGR